ncbi:MAG: glycosyltransferase [Cytophagales bacterium]
MPDTSILYLSYDGMTDPLGQSQVLPYLTSLSRRQYKIIIVSAEKKSNFEKRKNKIDSILKDSEGNIEWHPIKYTKKPPILSTLWDILKLTKKAKELHKIHHFRIIHCRSYIAATVGFNLSKKLNIKWIFDMRGFWADERVDGGLWPQNKFIYRLLYRYFKKKELQFLNHANTIVVLTHSAAKVIKTWNPELESALTVIPCCVDTQHFTPSRNIESKEKDFKLVYLGSIGTWYLLDEMLDFFNCLKSKLPSARFLIVTTDDAKMIYEKAKTKSIKLSDIEVKSAERSEIPEILQNCDASIFFIKPSFSKKGSSATKMGEILAMKLPIVTNKDVGDHQYLFENFKCGVLVENFNTESYLKSVDELLVFIESTPKDLLRETAQNYFSLEKGVELYHSIYQTLSIN